MGLVKHGGTHTRVRKTVATTSLTNVIQTNPVQPLNNRMLVADFVAIEPRIQSSIKRRKSQAKDQRKRNEQTRKEKVVQNADKGTLENTIINYCILSGLGVKTVTKETGYASMLLGFDAAQRSQTKLHRMLASQRRLIGE